MNGMLHSLILPKWFDLDWQQSRPEPFPIEQELRLMNLRPRFNESTLPTRQTTRDELDDVDGKYRDAVLVIGVEVRTVMR